jgi:hypothetical protein
MLHPPRILCALGVLLVGCGSNPDDPIGSPYPITPPSPSLTSFALDPIPNAWFVELDGDPEARGGDLESLRQQRKDFRSRLVDARIVAR